MYVSYVTTQVCCSGLRERWTVLGMWKGKKTRVRVISGSGEIGSGGGTDGEQDKDCQVRFKNAKCLHQPVSVSRVSMSLTWRPCPKFRNLDWVWRIRAQFAYITTPCNTNVS